MVIERVLDLHAVDVLAAADQHVLCAVDDVDKTFFVDLRKVARLHPAVDEGLGRGLGLVPVAAHDDGAAIPEFAHLVRAQRLPLVAHDLDLAGGRGHAAARGLALIVLGEIAGRRRRCLGHAPALAGLDQREAFLHASHQFRRRWRTAIGDGFERRQVEFMEARMLDDLPCDRGHAAGSRDALALDQLKRLVCIPFALHDDLRARHDGRHHDRKAARRMEQRHRDQRRLLHRRVGRGRHLAPAQERAGLSAHRVEEIRDDIAVRDDRALGLSGRARGVEDRGIVLRVERHRRQRTLGKRGPALGATDHIFKPTHARIGDLLARSRDVDALQIRTVVDVLAQPLPAFGIRNGDLGARVRQAILKLWPRPPRIERCDDRTRMDRSPEGNRPLRQVAHDDGNAVTLLHAVGDQLVGKLHHRPAMGIEGDALVFIDHVVPCAKGAAGLEHRGQ